LGFKALEKAKELKRKGQQNMKSDKGKQDLKKCHEGTARV
jgi:hypothetical protein